MFPLGRTGRNGEPEGTVEETKEVIRPFWRAEMDKADAFAEARMRHNREEAWKDDMEILHYLQRPRLDEVLAALEDFQRAVGPASGGEGKSWRVWQWFGWW